MSISVSSHLIVFKSLQILSSESFCAIFESENTSARNGTSVSKKLEGKLFVAMKPANFNSALLTIKLPSGSPLHKESSIFGVLSIWDTRDACLLLNACLTKAGLCDGRLMLHTLHIGLFSSLINHDFSTLSRSQLRLKL